MQKRVEDFVDIKAGLTDHTTTIWLDLKVVNGIGTLPSRSAPAYNLVLAYGINFDKFGGSRARDGVASEPATSSDYGCSTAHLGSGN